MQVVFIFLSLIVSLYDIKTGKISRLFFLVYEIIFLAYIFLFKIESFLPALLCGLYALGLFLAVRILSKNKMGLADVWYAAVSAETLSFFAWHKAMLLSCIFAGVYMVSTHKYKVPFIPFMSLGCIILILIKKT